MSKKSSKAANIYRSGSQFEEKTDIKNFLISKGFIPYFKKGFIKKETCGTIIYLPKNEFNNYFKKKIGYNPTRIPDESFMIIEEGKIKTVIILEKKNQNVEGSVELKLWAAEFIKNEYTRDAIENGFEILFEYSFCLCDFLFKKFIFEENGEYKNFKNKQKQYFLLKKMFNEKDINIFNGDSNKYFDELYFYIASFLKNDILTPIKNNVIRKFIPDE